VEPGKGLTIKQESREDVLLQRDVEFGDHMMDVLRKLGNPNKERSREGTAGKPSLLFLNYLEFGLDLGFSEESQRLVKIIMRTNQITDPIFGFYDRCFFQLPLHSDEESKDHKELIVSPLTRFSEIKPSFKGEGTELFYDNNLHQESLFSNFTHFFACPGMVVEVIPETD
jgi:hypothetical protein